MALRALQQFIKLESSAGILLLGATALALVVSPSLAAESLQHSGIWCTGKAEDGSCVSIYELLDDNTFAAYNLYAESQTRYDVFGRWDERPGKACILLQTARSVLGTKWAPWWILTKCR